jgi:hypothetical protein
MPLVFVKEDQGFTLAAIGLIIAIVYRRRASGLFLAGWGVFWSLLAILVIIPHFSRQHLYYYWYKTGSPARPAGQRLAGEAADAGAAAPRHGLRRRALSAGAGDCPEPAHAVRVR